MSTIDNNPPEEEQLKHFATHQELSNQAMSLQKPSTSILIQGDANLIQALPSNSPQGSPKYQPIQLNQTEEQQHILTNELKQQQQSAFQKNLQSSPSPQKEIQKSKQSSRKQSEEAGINDSNMDNIQGDDEIQDDDKNNPQKSIHNPEFLKQQQKKSDAFYAQLQRRYEEQKTLMESGPSSSGEAQSNKGHSIEVALSINGVQKQQENGMQDQNSTTKQNEGQEDNKNSQSGTSQPANQQLLDGRNIISSVGMVILFAQLKFDMMDILTRQRDLNENDIYSLWYGRRLDQYKQLKHNTELSQKE